MAFNIKNAEADRLAHELAAVTGETLTEAVKRAVEERLARLGRQWHRQGLRTAIADLQELVASLPDRDTRTADEIIGYDEHGLPV